MSPAAAALQGLPLSTIKLPPGFKISLYANASFPARFFAVGNRGLGEPTIVFVSSTEAGQVRHRAAGANSAQGLGAAQMHY